MKAITLGLYGLRPKIVKGQDKQRMRMKWDHWAKEISKGPGI